MSSKINKPTDSELEILQVLWERGKASVREVHEVLTQTKEAGYTTTLKLMQIMHDKGLVLRDDRSKVHIYTANVEKEKTLNLLLNKLANSLFGGSKAQLVMQALGDAHTTQEELDSIQALLDQLKKNHK